MNRLRDFSKLPLDAAYWENLEERIVSSAIDGNDSWTAFFAKHVLSFAALGAAAVIVMFLTWPATAPTAESSIGGSFDGPNLRAFLEGPPSYSSAFELSDDAGGR